MHTFSLTNKRLWKGLKFVNYDLKGGNKNSANELSFLLLVLLRG